ncbi:MAG: tRNA dihydrouridine synthase [Suipraeoptans sp.]
MKYYLAPLEGITTYIYRSLYHKYFTPLDKYFTPFLVPHTKRGLNNREIKEVSPEFNKGMHLVPQIMTNSSEGFLSTVKKLREYGHNEVNLNFGCPSKTVVKKGRGSGFLKFPEEIDHFLYDIFEKSDINISIKTRLGFEATEEFEELLAIYNKYPLKELIIHPRTGKEFYSGTVHIDVYLNALTKTTIPICYNGDIKTNNDIETILHKSDKTIAIMLGRGIIGNPFLFESDHPDFELMDRIHNFLLELLSNYRVLCGNDKQALFKLKEIFTYMQVLFPDDKKLLKKMRKSESISAFSSALNELF